ncbi:mechanosensitive ion channel domain-containing protein [Beggiatoa leptomitoformis]|uniref:Mechanosensitive ion channel n=1 Tax=Beggiatoa leptomitoformis TaxID=288004 RepID=A0A2N9YC67_9GAMM|nr:mechanosensitive ion channel domain-containing protein [Beggiatoa leptomitoformis]ALG66645.1 mechanosensitive ion channel [Beggiatoa leptomitoformis]AUI68036.1 mechanosensitive ion channel [Beggiatoa leptomitoformis]
MYRFLLTLFIFYTLIIQYSIAEPQTTVASPPETATQKNQNFPPVLNAAGLEERKQVIKDNWTALQYSRDAITVLTKQLENKIRELDASKITSALLENAEIDRDAAAIELEKILQEYKTTETTISNQKNASHEVTMQLAELQKTPLTAPEEIAQQQQKITALKNQLTSLQATTTVEEAFLQVMQERLNIAQERLNLLTEWHNALDKAYQERQKASLETQLQQDKQRYQALAVTLRQQLTKKQELDSFKQYFALEAKIQEADEMTQYVAHNFRLHLLQKNLIEFTQYLAQRLTEHEPEVVEKNLENMLLDTGKIIDELKTVQHFLENRGNLLQQQLELIRKRNETLSGEILRDNQEAEKIINTLNEKLQQQSIEVSILLQATDNLVTKLTTSYQDSVTRLLLRQRNLPDSQEEWQRLGTDISHVPNLLLQEYQLTLQGFHRTFEQTPLHRWGLLSVGVIIWLVLFIWIRQALFRLFAQLNEVNNRSFAASLFLTGLRLLHLNAIGIAVIGVFCLLLWLTQPTKNTILVSLSFVFLWLGIKFPINLLWLLFSSKILTKTPNRSRSYRQLRLFIILIAVFSMITGLGHILPIATVTRDLLDTCFMLFLSWTLIPIMHIRNLLLTTLEKVMKGYWLLVLRFVSLLVPLAVLAVSILGLLGYLNLGWYVAEHLTVSLLVLIGWLTIRGLLIDLTNILKNMALKHSEFGLLWTQDIIPLVQKITFILLFFIVLLVLFWANGWYNDFAVRNSLETFLTYPLFKIGETKITVSIITVSLITLWFVFWFGGWARRITYRWIYINVNDLGVRHSLSVFTQYMVILVGLLIVFQIIGIDLTTLTIFAGALGVGLGFGLQTIFNNFISGIILLVERPLKTGDLVNIGDKYEGEVANIGIRSLVVRKWDNQEVIVPNADIITNSFTNWTHSDDIVRFTLRLRISYDSDPYHVIKILTKVLQDSPDIVTAPPVSQVNLWEFGDSWMVFRVDYHINVRTNSVLQSRNRLTLHIWDALKAADIRMSYPQHELYVKNLLVDKADAQELFDNKSDYQGMS